MFQPSKNVVPKLTCAIVCALLSITPAAAVKSVNAISIDGTPINGQRFDGLRVGGTHVTGPQVASTPIAQTPINRRICRERRSTRFHSTQYRTSGGSIIGSPDATGTSVFANPWCNERPQFGDPQRKQAKLLSH